MWGVMLCMLDGGGDVCVDDWFGGSIDDVCVGGHFWNE